LNPSAFSPEAAEQWALDRAVNLPDDLFRLKALWYINYVVQPGQGERITRYAIRIAQTEEYGVCVGFAPELPIPDGGIVGEDARLALKRGDCRDDVDRIAVIDAILGHVSRPADKVCMLKDSANARYLSRAEIFAHEARKVLEAKGRNFVNKGKPKAVVIGATAGIIGALVKNGFHVTATDMWQEAVGKNWAGVVVQDGSKANERLIKDSDLAVITGLALANRTLEGLAKWAKAYNTSTIIWAITGRNFGHYYTENGIDSVVSDPTPFVLLPPPSAITIWRRKT
jgi:hypothetical protein